MEEIEEHFDKANIDLHSKIENSYHQLSTHIADHQQHIITEKQQFHKEQSIIKGTSFTDLATAVTKRKFVRDQKIPR